MRFLVERYDDNIFDSIEKHFIDYVGGAGYILPSGRIITPLSKDEDEFESNVHMNVETYLNNINSSNITGDYDTGSPTMRELGAIRLNDEEWENNYIELPNIRPSNKALDTLLVWLDKNSTHYDYIMVCSPGMKDCKKYSYSDYISDDIINKIKRYYSSGILYEDYDGDHIFYIRGTEVIKNPSREEMRQMWEEQKDKILNYQPGEPLIRSTYDENGNEYIWPAYDSTHYYIEQELYKKYGVRLNQNKMFDLFEPN